MARSPACSAARSPSASTSSSRGSCSCRWCVAFGPVGLRPPMSTEAATRPGPASFLLSGGGWPYLLVPFIPIAVVLEFAHAGATPIFLTSALGVIPTAALMGRATEELAARAGPGIGGLLNVTFGNAPELIIAFFAL